MVESAPETISISEFKATCLAVLERVRRTGRPMLITRHGEPIAEVVPPSSRARKRAWLGAMRGSATVSGNIVDPASDSGDWEALGE
ncbi:MAG: type II toxin-antitoxin system Phd/YefM family antitoxin [Gemmatimonadales bacterium]|nr:type II toxin-antitoxin system Phd/YefM family antitoxin [Gemmatimonadales bacterium]